jgi:hypothetical protein
MLFQLVLVKLSAVQKTVKLLWVAYLSWHGLSIAEWRLSEQVLVVFRKAE